MNINMNDKKHLVKSAWLTGTTAVKGKNLVSEALLNDQLNQADYVFAVGKAAASMCEGALDVFGDETQALIITKYNHTDNALKNRPNVSVIEAGHPIPDENSLRAGRASIEFMEKAEASSKLVVLVSGGASALAEDLASDMSLEKLQLFNNKLIAEGYTITQINARRQEISNIKGGKLLKHFKGSSISVYCISDVPGDDVSLIGSGLADPSNAPNVEPENIVTKILAKNINARNAVEQFAAKLHIPVIENEENLNADLYEIAEKLVTHLIAGPDGLYIWGGEPTILLPKNPGQGGRNQSLALAIAKGIRGIDNIAVIAAGTDGTDGPTDAAGGIVDGQTFMPEAEAEQALKAANAGPFLDQKDSLFKTGPTGTNIMDLVIALKMTDERAEFAVKNLGNSET